MQNINNNTFGTAMKQHYRSYSKNRLKFLILLVFATNQYICFYKLHTVISIAR